MRKAAGRDEEGDANPWEKGSLKGDHSAANVGLP